MIKKVLAASEKERKEERHSCDNKEGGREEDCEIMGGDQKEREFCGPSVAALESSCIIIMVRRSMGSQISSEDHHHRQIKSMEIMRA